MCGREWRNDQQPDSEHLVTCGSVTVATAGIQFIHFSADIAEESHGVESNLRPE
jgi:hypothetical protein